MPLVPITIMDQNYKNILEDDWLSPDLFEKWKESVRVMLVIGHYASCMNAYAVTAPLAESTDAFWENV